MHKKTIILVFSILLLSCNVQNSLPPNDALVFMDGFFEKVKQNDFDLVEPYYSERFFERTSRERWEELYVNIHLALGQLISVELTSLRTNVVVGTYGSGRYFTLVYTNKYENGYARETISLFLPRGSNSIEIIGHQYESDVFLGL